MAFMDKILGVMRLDPDDYDYDDDYDDDDYLDEKLIKNSRKKDTSKDEYELQNRAHKEEKAPRATNKVTPIGGRTRNKMNSNTTNMEVCVIKPTNFQDSREITETLLHNRTVVLNVEGLDIDIAQRIIDFVSGSCYAIDGNLQKISGYIFVVSPANVEISGDFATLVDGLDSGERSTDYNL